jgi:hypothetical protein
MIRATQHTEHSTRPAPHYGVAGAAGYPQGRSRAAWVARSVKFLSSPVAGLTGTGRPEVSGPCAPLLLSRAELAIKDFFESTSIDLTHPTRTRPAFSVGPTERSWAYSPTKALSPGGRPGTDPDLRT